LRTGNYLLYSVKHPQTTFDAKVVFTRSGDGFLMETPLADEFDDEGYVAADYEEDWDEEAYKEDFASFDHHVTVDLDGRLRPRSGKPIEPYFIDTIWISPVSAPSDTRPWGEWQVFVLEADGGGARYYEVNSGFLVGYRVKVGIVTMEATLTQTNIIGL